MDYELDERRAKVITTKSSQHKVQTLASIGNACNVIDQARMEGAVIRGARPTWHTDARERLTTITESLMTSFLINGPHAVAGHAGVTIDRDRLVLAEITRGGMSPLQAHLIGSRGWNTAVAQAYSLCGLDAGRIISRGQALDAGRKKRLIK
jgi:hypothetical protein